MANISIRATSLNTSPSAATLSVTAPSGTTTGDVVVVMATRNSPGSGDSIVDNNGGTPFTSDRADHEAGNGNELVIFSRRIQGGDPGSYSFTFSGDLGATRFSLAAITFADPDGSTIYDVAPSGSTVNIEGVDGGDITTVDINTATANSIHIIIGAREGGNYDDTIPTGYTRQFFGASFDQPMSIFSKIIGTPGATGSQTLTGAGDGAGISHSFALKNGTVPVPATTLRHHVSPLRW